MILIKPITSNANFYLVEVGIIFYIFWGLLPLLRFWFCVVEGSEPFDSFRVLIANMLESDGICAITTDVEYVHLRWAMFFPHLRFFILFFWI
jgi:hypothetical protein